MAEAAQGRGESLPWQDLEAVQMWHLGMGVRGGLGGAGSDRMISEGFSSPVIPQVSLDQSFRLLAARGGQV